MSLLSDTILSGGSTRLHAQHGGKVIRRSKSHGAGLLTPLVQLVRDPVGTLNNAVSSHLNVDADLFRADRNRRQILYLRMKDAESYDEWKAAATELDVLEGHEAWKEELDSPEYDAALVACRLRELDDARLSCDVRRMCYLIRTTLARDLGGMGALRLYKHSHIGTKKLIERYIDSAEKTLTALLDVSAKQGEECPLPPGKLVQHMLYTRQSFGRSALLLSGGGTFGMNHIGVVKCLWDAHLLPRIISGASAGSIICAVLCTRTDEEIPDVMHEFCFGELDVFEKHGEPESLIRKVVRMFTAGGLFDISHLMRVMRGLLGDITFSEAYNRTRRIMNIPVSTSSHFELPRLLNHITAPNVMVWSAVCTSCSVPLVYKNASLVAKDIKTGREVPWDPNPDATWIDGSVENDLPMTRLAEMWNVNHFIVSQVNPHVVPFLVKEEEMVATEAQQQPSVITAGPSWIGSMMGLVKGEALFRLQVLADQGIVPSVVTKLKSVLSQRYSGDINIFPQISLADFPRVLSNPTPEYMLGCMLTGQRATWPKLSRIQNHVAIELAIDATITKLRERAAFATPSTSLLTSDGRPVSQGDNLSQAKRSKSLHKVTRFESKTEPSSPVLHRLAPISPFLSRSFIKPERRLTSIPNYLTPSQTSDTAAMDILSPSSNPAEDSSDRDYFAEVDSDTTELLSSPSPITSPSTHGPTTTWPVTSSHIPASSTPQIKTSSPPTASTASDRRSGTILNLAMTSAAHTGTSSAEAQYKRLFHPSGQVEPEPIMEGWRSQGHGSHPGSRRGSVPGGLGNFTLDLSGTRGMLLRKKSFTAPPFEDATDDATE